MNDIVTAIYNLMGHPTEEKIDEDRIKAKVERIFNVSNFLFLSVVILYYISPIYTSPKWKHKKMKQCLSKSGSSFKTFWHC